MNPTTSQHRKWTATVMVAGADFTDMLDYDVHLADGSRAYTRLTLRDTTEAAVQLAAYLIREGLGSDASVQLYKQLAKDPAPVWDRSVYVYLDDRTNTVRYGA